MSNTNGDEAVIDVRERPPPHRHQKIFRLVDAPAPGRSFINSAAKQYLGAR